MSSNPGEMAFPEVRAKPRSDDETKRGVIGKVRMPPASASSGERGNLVETQGSTIVREEAEGSLDNTPQPSSRRKKQKEVPAPAVQVKLEPVFPWRPGLVRWEIPNGGNITVTYAGVIIGSECILLIGKPGEETVFEPVRFSKENQAMYDITVDKEHQYKVLYLGISVTFTNGARGLILLHR
jgi:hypothetical protein